MIARKQLKRLDPSTQAFVKYPAKLKVRKTGEKECRMHSEYQHSCSWDIGICLGMGLAFSNFFSFLACYIINLLLTIYVWIYIVRKGVPAPPFLRHPSIDLACAPPPIFKFLCPLPSFPFHPLLRYFRQFTPPSCKSVSQPFWPTNLSWFKQISKGWIYQFNCHFLSKTNFNLLNPFTNRLS